MRIHSQNETTFVEQSDQKVVFQFKNVDLPFRNGSIYRVVTYEEYLEFSEGVIAPLGKYMKLTFAHEANPEGWYKVSISTR